MFNRIVVALKPGLDARPLTDLAASVAEKGAAIHLVAFVRVGTDEDELARKASTEERLEETAGPLRQQGFEVSTGTGIVVADAAREITHAAQNHGADLLVIGLAKRSRVGKALLGSDAQAVLMEAACPVLSVRLVE